MNPGKLVLCALSLMVLLPVMVYAQDKIIVTHYVRDNGGSAIWILCNISYAGMLAQNQRLFGWRIISFIFGFPGTLLTLLVVKEGGERAYGIDLPKKKP